MSTISIVFFLVIAFFGYLVGRWGDNYLNFWMHDPSWTPHHWIYGYLLVLVGAIFFRNDLQLWITSFGLGLFISDLKDFMKLKFFGKDNKNKSQRKFWSID